MIKITEKTYGDIVKKVGQEKMNKIEQNNNKPATSEIVKVQPTRKESTFDHNTAKIIILHNSITSMLCKSLENAFEIGRLLFEQKEKIKSANGKFSSWAIDKLPFSARTAQRYMKLYQYQEALIENKAQTITEAYHYLFDQPISDEVIEVDDGVKVGYIHIKEEVDLEKIKLPSKRKKGMQLKLKLCHSMINELVKNNGLSHGRCAGRYSKVVIEMCSNDSTLKRIGELISVMEKDMMPGGKIIFYKP